MKLGAMTMSSSKLSSSKLSSTKQPPADATPICFATSNPHKLREAREILASTVEVEAVAMELEELQTTDLRELVRHKAQQAWEHVKRPVMVEDTSLIFTAWGVLPGVFIKYFLENMSPAALVSALEPSGNDAAEAVCGVGYHDGAQVHYFEGRVTGCIVSPRGRNGFGWDVIFQPRGERRSFAEMEAAEKNRYSMRGRALAGLAAHLRGR